MKSIIKQYKIILPTLIIGLILGWLLFPGGGQKDRLQNAADHEHLDEGGLWTCSMHPQIQQDKPGLCPICAMDLIPLEVTGSQEEGVDPMEVSMTSSAIKLAEIQTYRVGQTDMNKTLYLQGKVTFDERRVSEVTARFGGRIESLHVSFTGQEVQRGQKLASIYSPDILTAQKELQEAARLKESMPALYQAARNKLQLWSLSEEQINMIESAEKASTSFDILSPISGVVTMRHVAKGDYVKEGQQLFMIVDLKQLWIQFDAYESDLPWIKIGSMLTYRINGLPDLDFKAQVEFIDPIINAKTRVAQVRIGVDNHKGLLKPEMFVSGKLIASNTQKNVLIIPKSAVLWTGKRSLVYVQVEDRESPSFMMREITLGTDAGAFYEVLDGLKPDELVVSNGVFKIDAAAQLRGLRSMMNPSMGKAILAHDHGNMTTDANRVESQEMEGQHLMTEVSESGDSIEIASFDVDPLFQLSLNDLYAVYIPMKDAFVLTHNRKVRKAASKLKPVLEAIDMGLLEGAAHMAWMDQVKLMNTAIEKIIDSKDIEVQRLAFSDFNTGFYQAIKSFGLNDQKVYYQFCPMAFNDQGAYWISQEEIIANPYFGDVMLRCGEVREIIEN